MGKDIPMVSKLLKAMILEDYVDAMDIVTDEKFDPNEKTKSWGAPIISALITVLYGEKSKNLSADAKAVFKAIISHKDFNPNLTDRENETIMMEIARGKDFNWLAPFLLNCKDIDLSIKNYMGRTALDIASFSKNTVIRDILMTYNIKEVAKYQPKKTVGRKKKKTTAPQVTVSEKKNILQNIENILLFFSF